MSKSSGNIKLNTISLQQQEPNYELTEDKGIVSNRKESKSQIFAESGGMAGAAIGFHDAGDLVLTNMDVYAIFWGNIWTNNSTNPSANNVYNALGDIVSGPYMANLAQYRGITHANLIGGVIVTSPDPPNPFTNDNVAGIIQNLYQNNQIPAPNSDSNILYCVIMPPGINFSEPDVIGEHSYFNDNNFRIRTHFAWVMNNGTLDFVTQIASHELVESCTDPEGNGIIGNPGTCSGGGWCEIGDVCEGIFKTVNGVSVQKYYSQQNHQCI
jgi:hypothetical protein